MKNLFDYKSYRQYLTDLCSSQGAQRGYQSQLARAAGCQAAYFSQVLKQKVHLTEDQIYSLTEEMQLAPAETNFLTLLLRFEKAGTEKLRKHLGREITQAKAEQNRLSSRVPADQIIHSQEDLGRYFSSWLPSAIHVLTSSKNYQSVDKIAERLHLPKEDVKEFLDFLVRMKWVQKTDQKYQYSAGNIHVPKESPLQSSMQMTRRHIAMNSIVLNPADAIHYSSMFTLDLESFEELKKLTTSFVQKSAKAIDAGGTEELYTLCVDLFRVL